MLAGGERCIRKKDKGQRLKVKGKNCEISTRQN